MAWRWDVSSLTLQTATQLYFHWVWRKLFLYCLWIWFIMASSWNFCSRLHIHYLFTHKKPGLLNIKCLHFVSISSWAWWKSMLSNTFSFFSTKSPFLSISSNFMLCYIVSTWAWTISFINTFYFSSHTIENKQIKI